MALRYFSFHCPFASQVSEGTGGDARAQAAEGGAGGRQQGVQSHRGWVNTEYILRDLGTGLTIIIIDNILPGANFVNIEDADKFLTSADRQSILLHFLNSIRADKGDTVGEVTFREGEAISE